MKLYLILVGIALIFNSLSLGKLFRLILLRILYPKATIKQIESFEKNTKKHDFTNWFKKGAKSD
ncbi:hypothetical protein [Aureibaculum conchae]|uniref:hypothetical protein n=1 Tax=Aureibaculum sp. 2308TA14-22 TaxID=3108392 RepID=UPI003394B5D1